MLLLPACAAQSAGASVATNSPPVSPATKPLDQVAAPGTSENRSFALSLLKQRAECRPILSPFLYTETVSTEMQARGLQAPDDRMNGDHRMLQEFEARGDGNRLGVLWRTWGNAWLTADSVSEDRCPYNSRLWDGKTCFEYITTVDIPGRITIETRPSESRSRQQVSEMLTPLWTSWISRELASNAVSLSVRPRLEQVGQAQCYVIDATTRTPQESGNHTVWIDSERGNNIVQVTNSWRYPASFQRVWVSYSMDRLVFKDIEGVWTPVEGYVIRSDTRRGGGSTRRVEHHTLTKMTLKPDAQALGAFVPDDIKNGARVTIAPGPAERDPHSLPLWQDGRVLDRQGRVLFDSGLTNTNSTKSAPAGEK